MPVPYSYSRDTVNNPNPLARFAHRARTIEALTVSATLAPAKGRVLDYGCGPGLFLRMLSSRRPDLELVGYDPYFNDEQESDIALIDDMSRIQDRSIHLFTAFETCEHLDDSEVCDLLTEVTRTLTTRGRLLISVPIIGGPSLLAKELNKAILRRRRSEYTTKELFAAAFLGRPAVRPENRKATHKGFDFRELRKTLSTQFHLEREWFTPIPKLPWPLNSQHFSVWSVRDTLKTSST